MSAMVETLDAQMTDYSNSDDVFMQTHSDPWVQEDGTMDDDSFNSFNQTDVSKLPTMDSIVPIEASMSMPFSTISTSNSSLPMGEDHHAVEIEMEEYVEEPEYDMVDDEHVEEIHDIEVHDVHAGATQPIAIAPQISFSFSNESTTSIAEITSLVTPVPSTSRQSPAPTQESSTDQPAHHQDDGELLEDAESSQVLPTELETPAEVPAATTERVRGTVELERRDSQAAHFAYETAQDDIQGEIESYPSEQEAPGPPPGEPRTPLPTGADELRETVVAPEHTEDVLSEVVPVEPHDELEGAAAEGPNPHEISEGVYIEPPPGVLLEVPPSQHLYTLFNRPSYSSRSTPSHDEPDAGDDAVVLLHDRPTLFYEPIFSLFEALREEEPFSSSPDLRELELIFSFTSLNLVISEDNVYARQTSLHEVVMLHETFGGAGPLRVQLQLQPRFIIRFSELQSAMEQSAIGPSEEEEEVEIEVHGNAQSLEIVENGASEHLEAQSDPLQREVLQHPPQDQNPSLDVEGEDHPEAVEHLDPNEPSHLTQETPHEQDSAGVDDGQERQEPHEQEFAEVNDQEPQPVASGETVRSEDTHETEVDDLAEVGEEVHTVALGLDDGSERHNEGNQDIIEGHVEEDDDLVEYVEEFEEEEGEYYHEDHDDSDSTETPGDDHETPHGTRAHEETTGDYEANVDEGAHTEELAGSSVFLGESNGTDDDGLAHDVDGGPDEQDATPGDHSDHQEGGIPADDYQELVLHERRAEDSTEGGSEHVEPVEEFPDFSELPDLPEEDDEFWDDEQDGEGEIDQLGEHEYEPIEDNEESASNDSSVTLSSKGSKRAYSEVDDDHEEDDDNPHTSLPTPGNSTSSHAKRVD